MITSVNIISCYIKIIALECKGKILNFLLYLKFTEIIEYNNQTLNYTRMKNFNTINQSNLVLDDSEKNKIKLIKYLLNMLVKLFESKFLNNI